MPMSIDFTDSSAIDLYTTAWLSVMQRYRFLQQQGIPTCTIRYENLVADPQKIVSAIFEYCGLSIAEVSQACQVFAKDSQSGSNLSKENLSKHEIQIPNILEIRQKVDKLLQKHPEIKTPDFLGSRYIILSFHSYQINALLLDALLLGTGFPVDMTCSTISAARRTPPARAIASCNLDALFL
jgi:hypothetical protein